MASIRTFAVFRDEPEALPADDCSGTSATTIALPPPSGPLLVYAPDKENVDPSSGSRVITEQGTCKKRKTALTTKSQPVSPSKKPRPLSEKPVKKASSKSRTTDKKVKRAASSKRGASSRVRKETREPSLPRLVEEGEDVESLEQIAINSRCKELTVLPLADISEAYEQVAPKGEVVGDDAKDVEKASVAAPSGVKSERPSTPPPSRSESSASPVKGSTVGDVFSTPERKKVYSSFTFSSPCAAGDRFASARATSVDRFSDVVH